MKRPTYEELRARGVPEGRANAIAGGMTDAQYSTILARFYGDEPAKPKARALAVAPPAPKPAPKAPAKPASSPAQDLIELLAKQAGMDPSACIVAITERIDPIAEMLKVPPTSSPMATMAERARLRSIGMSDTQADKCIAREIAKRAAAEKKAAKAKPARALTDANGLTPTQAAQMRSLGWSVEKYRATLLKQSTKTAKRTG